MLDSYANITLQGPPLAAVVDHLNASDLVAFVAPAAHGYVEVFHRDLASQEELTAELSRHFECAALLVMTYARRVLMYQLHENGRTIDAYLSEAHPDLSETASLGDAETLCDTFGRPLAASKVRRILHQAASAGNGFELAQNRHGALAAALNMPTWIAGIGFEAIEAGEMPAGPDFDFQSLHRTGSAG